MLLRVMREIEAARFCNGCRIAMPSVAFTEFRLSVVLDEVQYDIYASLCPECSRSEDTLVLLRDVACRTLALRESRLSSAEK